MIDRHSNRPVYLQIYDQFRKAITKGDLPPGGRLPSSRTLARRLSVSRHTVLNAYDLLLADGLVAGRIGSGTRVQGTTLAPRVPDIQLIAADAHYPVAAAPFRDLDGIPLHVQRS